VGDRRLLQRLAAGAGQAGACPLAAFDLRRHARAPDANAPRIDPAELVRIGGALRARDALSDQYQWTLLEGVNDGDEELDGIVRLLAGKYAVMNLIPWNSLPGTTLRDRRRSARPRWRATSTSAACSPSCAIRPDRTSMAVAVSCARAAVRAEHSGRQSELRNAGRNRLAAGQRRAGFPHRREVWIP